MSQPDKDPKDDSLPDPYFDLILDKDIAENRWPKEKMEKYKKADHVSIMAQVVTEELFEKYKDHKTKHGWTIARAINTGVMYPSSFDGIHAGDHESYHDFKEVFYPFVEKHHVGFKCGEKKLESDLDADNLTVDLSESAQSKIVSTRIRVARNLNMFPLNPASTKENRMEVIALMEKVFATLPDDLSGDLFRHTTMTDEEREKLVADHFLFRGRDKMQAASGYHQYWPHGRGIFITKDKTFLLWLNEGDHCRIISMEKGGDVKKVFERLGRGIKAIEAGVKEITGEDKAFMEDETFGAITCCPSNLGTGMRGSVHILIPKMIKEHGLAGIDKMCRELFCQARGSSGEHSAVVDRVDISNWRRLGANERVLVEDMIKCVNMITEKEDALPDE